MNSLRVLLVPLIVAGLGLAACQEPGEPPHEAAGDEPATAIESAEENPVGMSADTSAEPSSDTPAEPSAEAPPVRSALDEATPPLAEDAIADCVLTPPDEPVMCTQQYDPVCGCDGKTYGNACTARGAGVPRSTPGACESELD